MSDLVDVQRSVSNPRVSVYPLKMYLCYAEESWLVTEAITPHAVGDLEVGAPGSDALLKIFIEDYYLC